MLQNLLASASILLCLAGCNQKTIDARIISAPVSILGPAPVVNSISPSSWGVKGNTQVTIVGSLFTTTSTVSLGGSVCTSVIVDSDTQIRCTIPYHPAAAVDVVVTNPDGQTGVLQRGFSYNSFIYVTTQGGAAIFGYIVDSKTSVVTAVGSVASPAGGYQMVVDPTNTRLYAACATANQVAAYTINPQTAALTPIAGSPFAGGSGANGIAMTRDGTRLFSSNFSGANITAFTVNTLTGALTQVGAYPAGTNPGAMTTDAHGDFLYATNYGSGSISAYAINADGSLTPLSGSPYTVGGASGEDGIVFHPSGKWLYAGSAINPANVSGWLVNKTSGLLSSLGVYSMSPDNGNAGSGVAIDSTGQYLYGTAFQTGSVRGFKISSSGVLTALTPTNQYLAQVGTNYIQIQTLGKLVVTANTTANSFTVFQRSTQNGQLSGAQSYSIGQSPGTVLLTD